MDKLRQLSFLEGRAINEIIDDAVIDSVCPGICMNKGCEYTTGVEPDQDRGWCENCNTNTVKSVLVLAGII